MTSLERVGAPARQVNPRVWRGALFLAERYHWKPAGTERPQMPPDVIHSKEARAFRQWERIIDGWGGGYTGSVGALVTGPDSRAMGEALTVALGDVPNHAPASWKPSAPRKVVAMLRPEQQPIFATPTEQLGGPWKHLLVELVEFLLEGRPFRIH